MRNPKEQIFKPRSKRRFWQAFGELENPIEREIREQYYLDSSVFGTFGSLVPYFGAYQEYSHSVLLWLIDRVNLSETHSAVIQAKLNYGFKGGLIVKEREDDIFLSEKTELLPQKSTEVLAYKEAVKKINIANPRHIVGLLQEMAFQELNTGNVFIHLSWAGEGQNMASTLKVLKTRDTAYVRNDDLPYKQVIHSFFLDRLDLFTKEEHHEIYPVSEIRGNGTSLFWKEDENGVKHTVFHIKEVLAPHRFWYGQPSWLAAFNRMYNEQQSSVYTTKEAQAGFPGHLLIEVEEGPNQFGSGLESTGDDTNDTQTYDIPLEEEYTSINNTFGRREKRLSMTERPHGARPFTSLHIPSNTHHEYYRTMAELDSTAILRIHSWSDVLLGGDKAAASLNGSAYWQELEIRDLTTIRPLQNTIASFANRILDTVWALSDNEDFRSKSIEIVSPHQTRLKERQKALENVDEQ